MHLAMQPTSCTTGQVHLLVLYKLNALILWTCISTDIILFNHPHDLILNAEFSFCNLQTTKLIQIEVNICIHMHAIL